MMSDNVMVTPLFHQRSHSMPVGHAFINNTSDPNGVAVMDGTNNRTFDYKRSSPLKNDLNSSNTSNPPLPTPKSLPSQLHTKSSATNPVVESEHQQDSEPKFFCNPKNILNVSDYNRKTSSPVLFNCKMDRGFFISQSHWTCYRRNYFQVTASFIIPGHTEGTPYALQLNPDKPMQPIQQFLLRLKACTSTSNSNSPTNISEETILENHNMIRPVALTQMTPKRDKGPQREPPMTPIDPSDSVYGSDQACVTFERLQFRVATANNGKRRASQQYFRLIFELVAQLEEDGSQHVVSECYSSPLVVRGRSPGHYSSDNQYQQVQQQHKSSSSGSSSGESLDKVTKKRKLASPTTPSPMQHEPTVVSSSNHSSNEKEVSDVTLPPPQYIYASPPMMMEQHHPHIPSSSVNTTTTTTTSTTPSSYHMMPVYNQPTPTSTSAFSNFHHRSQSANDSDYYSKRRQPYKYHPNNGMMEAESNHGGMFDPYDGMARALRNWQQQVIHQRTDSAATYDSFDNNRASTRPGTPIPYSHHGNEVFNHHHHHSGGWSSSSPTTHHYNNNSNENNEKNRYQTQDELYNNNTSGNNN